MSSQDEQKKKKKKQKKQKKKQAAPMSIIFGPSPPLSASAGASDCELDTNANVHRQTDSSTDSSPDSSPLSLASTHLLSQSIVAQKEAAATHPRRGRSGSQRHRADAGNVDKAYSLIHTLWQDKEQAPAIANPEWHVLRITAQQYRQLCQRLKTTDPRLFFFLESDLRADYDPDDGLLVLRLMETQLHATFIKQLDRHIHIQLHLLTTNHQQPAVAALASKITSGGTGRVLLEGGSSDVLSRKYPDGQYRFGVSLPQFIFEVGYSQKAAALELLAKKYFEDVETVKTVLTVHLPYTHPNQRAKGDSKQSQEAAFSLYRGPNRIHNHTRFRDVHGHPIADAGFQLLLTDFLPNDVLAPLPPDKQAQVRDTVIDIPSQELCQFLAEAEAMQKLDDDRQRALQEPTSPSAQRSKKRKAVSWAPVFSNTEAGDGTSQQGDTSEDESPSRSKKQRTGAADQTYYASRRPGSASAEAGERRRTRSSSRGTHVGSEGRMTRSRSRSEGLGSGVGLSEGLS